MTDRERRRAIRAQQPPVPDGFDARHDALLFELTQREDMRMKRKIPHALILALVLVLAIGVAVAAGLGVFGQFAGQDGSARLQNLENVAQTYDETRTAPAAGEHYPEIRFTVQQAHYDGESLYVAYTLSGPMTSLVYRDMKEAEGIEWDMTPADQMSTDWESALSAEDYAAFLEKVQADGGVLADVYSQFLGDGARLEDGTYINPSATDAKFQPDGSIVGYVEFEHPLPEAARNQDSLTLVFDLLRSSQLYYLDSADADFAYYKWGERVEPRKLTVTVARSGETQAVSGHGEFDGYTVDVTGTVSDVDVRVDITVAGPAAEPWVQAWVDWETDGGDTLWEYALYDGDAQVKTTDFTSFVEGEALRFQMGFERPQQVTALTLRPVFRDSGERPAEAVVLE